MMFAGEFFEQLADSVILPIMGNLGDALILLICMVICCVVWLLPFVIVFLLLLYCDSFINYIKGDK